jgi:DNA-directed RNA polymerase specialized sigma24 family protein
MDDAGLFAELYPALRRFAAAVSGLGVDPDDLVQEAVVRTLRRGPLIELDEPATYLRRAIVNLARNQHRDSTRRGNILRTVPPPDDHVDAYPSDFVDLSNLSVEQRAVLFLKYVEHRDTDDIAALLDLSPDAVRARSSRAIRALRLELDRTEPLR